MLLSSGACCGQLASRGCLAFTIGPAKKDELQHFCSVQQEVHVKDTKIVVQEQLVIKANRNCKSAVAILAILRAVPEVAGGIALCFVM